MPSLNCAATIVVIDFYITGCLAATKFYNKPANREKRSSCLEYALFVFVFTLVATFSVITINSGLEPILEQMFRTMNGQ